MARLPAELLDLLPERKATAIKDSLRAMITADRSAAALMGDLADRARSSGWTPVEVDKLLAYAEFFSDQIAPAYQRVVAGRLAETDFDLLMTACVHLYLADRFEEGYGLLTQFKSEDAVHMDHGEYLAFAGYMAAAAGKDMRQALGYFDAALDKGVRTALLMVNSYPIYFEAGDHRRTDQVRRLIHEHYAGDSEAVFAVACVELCRDYYAEGFRLAEIRYQMPEAARSINPSLLDKPRWQGGSIAGKKLLVHSEQGLGDTVMCARYLPLVQQAGVDFVLECPEAAIPLLTHNFPSVPVIGGEIRQPVTEPFDVWVGAMSLPFIFKSIAGSIPATDGYLTPPPEAARYWQGRVAALAPTGRPRVGIAWSGNPRHRADKRRSFGFERIAGYLEACPDVSFFALQTANLPEICPANLINVTEELVTLADTAALIAEMDLVITVDTSIVHIAGALGHRTWLLLPYRYEWRWSLEGEANNWYDSVRVLRQPTHGDWFGLLGEVFGERLPAFLQSAKRQDPADDEIRE